MSVRRMLAIFGVVLCAAFLTAVLMGFSSRPQETGTVGWKEDFDTADTESSHSVPEGWTFRGKPGTPKTVFSVVKGKGDGQSYLHMEADKATGSVICQITGVDLERTPILRWRWRVTELPEGADGRVKAKDDQAIGIYLGTGGMLSNKSVSYRWDTDTPDGAKGDCVYGGGTVKVKWYTLRNKEDAKHGKWYVEERDCARDFKEAWGFCPGKIFLSVCCNSQYTGTEAEADLDWIEFVSGRSDERN